MCKHEGFSYAPSDSVYWQHGHSTERDYIYVTTQTLSRAQLEALSEEVGEDRALLVCCGAFRIKRDAFANLTLKKIPNAVLNHCEFGQDDYSLAISNLSEAPDELGMEQADTSNRPKGKDRKTAQINLSLFEEDKA